MQEVSIKMSNFLCFTSFNELCYNHLHRKNEIWPLSMYITNRVQLCQKNLEPSIHCFYLFEVQRKMKLFNAFVRIIYIWWLKLKHPCFQTPGELYQRRIFDSYTCPSMGRWLVKKRKKTSKNDVGKNVLVQSV